MTDRLKGFVITLEQDIREDDADIIKQSICMVRGVLDCTPVLANFHDHVVKDRIKQKLRVDFLDMIDNI